jgi:hypothetical protein
MFNECNSERAMPFVKVSMARPEQFHQTWRCGGRLNVACNAAHCRTPLDDAYVNERIINAADKTVYTHRTINFRCKTVNGIGCSSTQSQTTSAIEYLNNFWSFSLVTHPEIERLPISVLSRYVFTSITTHNFADKYFSKALRYEIRNAVV